MSVHDILRFVVILQASIGNVFVPPTIGGANSMVQYSGVPIFILSSMMAENFSTLGVRSNYTDSESTQKRTVNGTPITPPLFHHQPKTSSTLSQQP